jgi:hypothetical protein
MLFAFLVKPGICLPFSSNWRFLRMGFFPKTATFGTYTSTSRMGSAKAKLPFLWDSGAYFDEECLKAGKLHLFAHFERKTGGNIEW